MITRRWVGVLVGVVCAGWLGVGVAAADEVFLTNGDRLTGVVVQEDDQQVTVEHPVLGRVTVSQSFVARVVREPADAAATPQPRQQPVVEAAAEIEPEQEPSPWKREAELGYAMTKGNTNTEQLTGKVKGERKRELDLLTLQADSLYSSTKKKMDAQKYGGAARYERDLAEDSLWYQSYAVDLLHDRFANIQWRGTPSAGVGYRWADTEDWKLKTELGAGWEHTEYRDNTDTRDEATLIPRLVAQKRLFEKATLSQELTSWHPLGSRSGEYRLKSETALTNPLSEKLSLRFSVIDEYNSDPTGASEKNDLRITSGLVAAF